MKKSENVAMTVVSCRFLDNGSTPPLTAESNLRIESKIKGVRGIGRKKKKSEG